MQIKRYCGRERLPGGTRLWQKLAKAAGYTGRLELYGYGVGGNPGRQQRAAYRHGNGGYVQGDWRVGSIPETIRVWLRCSCQTVEFDPDLDLAESDAPLQVFVHELGHAIQHRKGRMCADEGREEAVATRYGRMLLRRLS